MKWFLYSISSIWIAGGCCSILYTGETRDVFKNIFEGTDRRLLSVLPFIAGILFLFSVSASRYPWFIRLLGLKFLFAGVLAFSIPSNLYDKLINWYLDSLSDQTHRLFGIITIILGTAILSWIL